MAAGLAAQGIVPQGSGKQNPAETGEVPDFAGYFAADKAV